MWSLIVERFAAFQESALILSCICSPVGQNMTGCKQRGNTKKTKGWYKKKTKSKFKNTFLYLPSQNGSEHWGHTAPLPLKLRLTCPELCFSCIPSPKFISKPCLCGDPQKDIYMRFGTGIEYFQISEERLTNSCVTKISQ